jgi:phage shock protein PspC (stress-responsive transcriptional regulator)
MEQKKLQRSSTNKMIAGVCAGLGEYFGIDPTLVRLIFLVLALAASGGIWIYIILWIVMPEEPSDTPTTPTV